jgi:quaternary ammonium compound-resistance protein SugE
MVVIITVVLYNNCCAKTYRAGTSQEGEWVMAWIMLFVAGLFEVGFAMGLKYSEGFTRLWPTLFMAAAGALSFYLLSGSMKTLPVGTAYAVWTGIGAVGTVVLGIVFLKEPSDLFRLLSILLIVAGIAGLKISSAG